MLLKLENNGWTVQITPALPTAKGYAGFHVWEIGAVVPSYYCEIMPEGWIQSESYVDGKGWRMLENRLAKYIPEIRAIGVNGWTKPDPSLT